MSIYLSYYLEMQQKQNLDKKLPSLNEIKSNYINYLLDLTKNDLEETAKILDVPKSSLLNKILK
jgi:transcriptional regulator with PAS, ATPase and Fis domain